MALLYVTKVCFSFKKHGHSYVCPHFWLVEYSFFLRWRCALTADLIYSYPAIVQWKLWYILFHFFIWIFFIMFSSEGNISEAARVCWCCQLCLTQVTELSAQRCSHLRSWHPTAVSEQQTHFTITPLSLTPPLLTRFLLISFDIPPLFTHLIYCFFSLPAPFLLSHLPYFHTCALPFFIVWFCCQPSTLTEHTVFFFALIFSLNFPSCLILWLTHISSLSVFTFSLHLSPHSDFHFSLSTT